MPQFFDSPDDLADAVIASVGRKIVLGLPVGLGKAAHVANALYARAAGDPSIDLTVFTALTLEAPAGRGDLEARFIEPLAKRLYGDWPRLDYAEAVRRESLPQNIRVREFYFRPAAYLGRPGRHADQPDEVRQPLFDGSGTACVRMTILEVDPGPSGDTCVAELAPLVNCG